MMNEPSCHHNCKSARTLNHVEKSISPSHHNQPHTFLSESDPRFGTPRRRYKDPNRDDSLSSAPLGVHKRKLAFEMGGTCMNQNEREIIESCRIGCGKRKREE